MNTHRILLLILALVCLCKSNLSAQINSLSAPKASKVSKSPLRKQSSPNPKRVNKNAISTHSTQEPSRVAPVPLQAPIEVENPSKNALRMYNTVQNNMEYDWLDKVHLGFAFSLVAFDYRIVSNKSAIGGAFPTTYVNLGAIKPAFGVSGLVDLHINQFFSFRVQAGFAMGNREFEFFGTEGDERTRSMSLEAIMIELPMLLKYKAMRISNVRPYVVTGLTPTVNVAAFGKFNEEKGIYLAVNPYDLHFNIGIGLDFYLSNFKVGVEAKYTTGFFNNITKDALVSYEQYPASIVRAFAQTFVLSILFDG
jgi:hypothetical protein